MKKIYLFITILSSFLLLNACKTDDFIDTQIGAEYSSYAGKIDDLDTIFVNFTNGKNEHYKLISKVSNTEVVEIISSSSNYVVVKYLSSGTTNLIIQYYAKASIVSNTTVTLTCNSIGGGGSDGYTIDENNLILFKDNNTDYWYLIRSDGSNKTKISGLTADYATLSNDGSTVHYSNSNIVGSYTLATKENFTSRYSNNRSITDIKVSTNNYISLKTGSTGGKSLLYANGYIYSYSFSPNYYTTYSNNGYASIDVDDFYLHYYSPSLTGCQYLSTAQDLLLNQYELYYYNYGYKTYITSSYSSITNFKISPDGNYIGYLIQNKLYVYSLNDYNTYTFNDFSYGTISDFQFSQDGTQVLIAGNTYSSAYNDLYIKNSNNTGTLQNITNTASISEISPDWK